MKENQSSYRSIMKATSLFGGVQVFKIIIAIVRSKFIAIFLGPAGMGIEGLLSSATGMISSLTNFGLGVSAVRNIASANESGNHTKIIKITSVVRKLVWLTGLFGALATIILAPNLSQITFGNQEYTLPFVWLSCTLLFNQLTSGQNVLLQGMRKLQYLAKANLAGSIAGLLISLPLYYFFGINGIVPALITISVLSFLFTWYFASKIKLEKVKVKIKEIFFEGKEMLKMGFVLSLSGLITVGSSYIIRIYIGDNGGIDDVGLYTAGFAIIFSYTGLIFNAMATDYYPKLSGVSNDSLKTNLLINQQAEIALLILAPILTIFLIFINWIILILYTTKFLPINEMIHWAALGMYFKVVAWSLGFVLLAKGNSKIFFWSELITNIYMLIFNVLGYKYYGLEGLGFSFLVSYFFLVIQVYFIVKYKYEFKFNYHLNKIFGIQFMIGVLCFCTMKFIQIPWAYILGIPFIILSSWYSFFELDKRMDIKELFNNLIKK